MNTDIFILPQENITIPFQTIFYAYEWKFLGNKSIPKLVNLEDLIVLRDIIFMVTLTKISLIRLYFSLSQVR